MVRVCLVLWETTKQSSKMVIPFCIPISNSESSCYSITSPAFDSVSVPDFGHSNRYIVMSHCCFNLHFPDDIWCGAFFSICLFAICISSFIRCLLRSLAHFLNWVVGFFTLVFSHVWLCVTLWTIACQSLLSMVLSRQEYWSALPCPPPGDLPDLELHIIFDCLTTLTSNFLKF